MKETHKNQKSNEVIIKNPIFVFVGGLFFLSAKEGYMYIS